MLHVIVSVLTALPPLADVAQDDPVLFVHVPQALSRLGDLEQSALAPLASFFLPAAERQKLIAAQGGDLLWVVYRNVETQSLDTWLGVDAGSSTPGVIDSWARELKLRGYEGVAGEQRAGVKTRVFSHAGRSLFLFEADGRCGLASRLALSLDMTEAARKPLSQSQEMKALVDEYPQAAVRGRLSLPKYYGYLARGEQGAFYSGVLRRLGLDNLGAVTLALRLDGKKRLETRVRVAAPKPWQGVLDALGPALGHEASVETPWGTLASLRVSLHPGRLWVVAQKLLAQASAVEFTLAQAQLDALEDEAKVRADAALGDAPRVWSLFAFPGAGVFDWVVVAPIADAGALAKLIERYGRLLPNIAPDLKLSAADAPSGRILTLGWTRKKADPFLVMAFETGEANRVVVASSAAALAAFAKKRGKAQPFDAGAAVLSGVVEDQALVTWLFDLGGKPAGSLVATLADAVQHMVGKRQDVQAALDSTSVALEPNGSSFELRLTTGAR